MNYLSNAATSYFASEHNAEAEARSYNYQMRLARSDTDKYVDGAAVYNKAMFADGTEAAIYVHSRDTDTTIQTTYQSDICGNYVFTAGGDDIVYGQDSNTEHSNINRIWTGAGDDTIYGGNRQNWVDAGDGDDTIYGGKGVNSLYGGRGNDIINGGNWNNKYFGGEGDNEIHAGNGHNLIVGGRSMDIIHLGSGTNVIFVDPSQTENYYGYDFVTGFGKDDFIMIPGMQWVRDTLNDLISYLNDVVPNAGDQVEAAIGGLREKHGVY